jgi:hypothetical protein
VAKVGRPSNYDKSFVEKAEKYSVTFKKDEAVPTIEGLAICLKIPRPKVYIYMRQHEEFRDTVEKIMAMQGKWLISYGLMNKFNSSIVRLLLASHGYRDEQRVEHGADETQIAKIDKLLTQMSKIIK